MIIQRCALSLCMVLGMQMSVHGAELTKRPVSAPTVSTQAAVEITPRAASDSAVSKKIEYQQWKAAAAIIWGIHDHDFLKDGHMQQINYEEGDNLLPRGYQQPKNIFDDTEIQQAGIESLPVALPEPSLPTFHVRRPDKSDTTNYVKKPRQLESEDMLKDETASVGLNRDKHRADLYNKLGVRRIRVPSPSSRVPAKDFHETGIIEGFSPVPPVQEDELQFKMYGVKKN